ncbi:MAG: efflux transporter outer membrane subunit [Thermodesulfobacteriota bacterium]
MFRFWNFPNPLFIGCLLLTFAAGGCMTPGPSYEPSRVELPAVWHSAPGDSSDVDIDKGLARWWERFDDPLLTSLIERAFDANVGLRAAEARIREARAVRRGVASGEGPHVSVDGSYKNVHSPSSASVRAIGSDGYETNQYQAGFDTSWEIDLFGGIRRAVEAADADIDAQVEAVRGVRVSLAAEVASAYVDLRTAQQRLIVAKSALETQKRTLDLTQKRYRAGLVTRLDVVNAEAQVASTESTLPVLEVSFRQAAYALAVLLGKAPGELDAELSHPAAIPCVLNRVPVGVPADLSRRRPDIRKAEAAVHAATARIGVATADLFPKVYLMGNVGYQSTSASTLLDWSSRFWSIGPSISLPVFDSGKIRSNIAVKEAQQEQALLNYRQTVLTALQEVEYALTAATKEASRQDALRKAVEANRRALDLALRLYSGGQTDFLNVLQAEKALYASEDTLYQSFRTVSTQLVALYKALGGGWEAQEL